MIGSEMQNERFKEFARGKLTWVNHERFQYKNWGEKELTLEEYIKNNYHQLLQQYLKEEVGVV